LNIDYWRLEIGYWRLVIGATLGRLGIGATLGGLVNPKPVLSKVEVSKIQDDWVFLAPTRWKLRRAIASVNQILASLKLKQHPDKTFIGYINKGFDFSGYHFSRAGLAPAQKTVVSFFEDRLGGTGDIPLKRRRFDFARSGIPFKQSDFVQIS
jgi:hypothetical protein